MNVLPIPLVTAKLSSISREQQDSSTHNSIFALTHSCSSTDISVARKGVYPHSSVYVMILQSDDQYRDAQFHK